MDNKKQPKPQDDSGQTLEERVDEFMAPVESSDSMPTSDTKPPQKIGNKIKVIHADDEAESTPPAATAPADEPAPTAPLVPASTPKKKSIAVSIAGADEVEAAPAPPPKPKPTKKVIAISDEGDLATIPEEVTPIVPELETSTVVSDEQLEANPDDSEDGDKVAEASTTVEPEPTEPQQAPDQPEDTATAATDAVEPEKPEDAPLADDLDTPEYDEVVEAIVSDESDTLLAVQDRQLVKPTPPAKPRRSFAAILKSWWRNKTLRWISIGLFVAIFGGAAAYPATRYYALNAVGTRSAASLQVIDESTFQPLKNVNVTIAGSTAQTDQEGRVRLDNLRLGSTDLVIEKRAFAPIHKSITLGWGSNPLGGFNLTPVGTQYSISVTDYLSKQPLGKAQATAGDANAQSDEKGVIKLTLDHDKAAKDIDVTISLSGYREERLIIKPDNKQQSSVALVPANKDIFISKRSGKFDVYAVYIDSKDEKLLLPGTGNEQDNLTLLPSPDGQVVALVSTRDDVRNDQGFLQSTLTIINATNGEDKTVTHSEQIKPIGWADNRLVYVQIAAGTSAGNPGRVKLMSYDYQSADNRQLATTNYFNDVMLVNNKVYYAPSSTYQAEGVAIHMFAINPDGSGKQTILAEETWNLFRVGYDDLVISATDQKWFDYRFANQPTKLDGAPGNLNSRAYIDSNDGKHSLWVDSRDGKGVLLAYNTSTKEDKVLLSKGGLALPVRWLNDSTLVYRISNSQETADYALNINGGEPRKVTDVTNTSGVDRWYYY